jgi:cytochrome c-type biogenesis protein CcmH/NrfG
MKPESIVLAVAGTFFGLLVGWIIGSQAGVPRTAMSPAPTVATQPPADPASSPQGGQGQQPRPLDEAQAQALRTAAEKNPSDAASRVQLGNLYFDSERFGEAATWYEAALKLNPNDPNVSTDLGVSFYYLNQADRALQQFDRSLEVDPKHAKTLLNQGIVRAFGKQDLKGAAASWQKLIDLAPTSPEADAARRALQGLKSAHPELDGSNPVSKPGL